MRNYFLKEIRRAFDFPLVEQKHVKIGHEVADAAIGRSHKMTMLQPDIPDTIIDGIGWTLYNCLTEDLESSMSEDDMKTLWFKYLQCGKEIELNHLAGFVNARVAGVVCGIMETLVAGGFVDDRPTILGYAKDGKAYINIFLELDSDIATILTLELTGLPETFKTVKDISEVVVDANNIMVQQDVEMAAWVMVDKVKFYLPFDVDIDGGLLEFKSEEFRPEFRDVSLDIHVYANSLRTGPRLPGKATARLRAKKAYELMKETARRRAWRK